MSIHFSPWSLWLALDSTVFLSHGRPSISRSSFSDRLDTNDATNGQLPGHSSHHHEQWPIPSLCTAHPLQRSTSAASRHVDCGAEGTPIGVQRTQEEDEAARTAGGTDFSTDRGGVRRSLPIYQKNWNRRPEIRGCENHSSRWMETSVLCRYGSMRVTLMSIIWIGHSAEHATIDKASANDGIEISLPHSTSRAELGRRR